MRKHAGIIRKYLNRIVISGLIIGFMHGECAGYSYAAENDRSNAVMYEKTDGKTEAAGKDKSDDSKSDNSKKEDDNGSGNNNDDEDKTGEAGDLENKEYLTKKDIDKLKIGFAKESYAVITYDTVSVAVETNIPKKFRKINYVISTPCISADELSNKIIINIRGQYEGTAKLTVKAEVDYYKDNGEYEGTKTLTSYTDVKVLDSKDYTLTVGEQCTLEYRNYEEYEHMKYELEKPDIAIIDEKGILTAIAEGYSRIFLTDINGKRVYVGSIAVNGTGIDISEKEVTRALGSIPYKLYLKNIGTGTVVWTSSNPAVASVDEYGNVTPIAAGQTVITAVYTTVTGVSASYTCTYTVTSPMLNITSCNLAKDSYVELKITGTTGQAEWLSSDTTVASVYSSGYSSRNVLEMSENSSVPSYLAAAVYAHKKGNVQISVSIDGITLYCNITVTKPSLKKGFYVVAKGTKTVLKIKGTNSASTLEYSSSNKKVATVSSDGIVTTVGKGYAAINIEVDHTVLTASINVGSAKAVKAVNKALKAEGAIYSQARRMSKGYYDCSSLVWRSYSPYKMYFGDRYYAPVAANEAKYCVKHNMTVPLKKLKNLNKLQPGDLLFMKRRRNGRYKNIYHVAIYMGQERYGSYSYGKIVHADGKRVSQANIYNEENIVVIGRPFK